MHSVWEWSTSWSGVDVLKKFLSVNFGVQSVHIAQQNLSFAAPNKEVCYLFLNRLYDSNWLGYM